MKKKNTLLEAVKAVNRANREDEIKAYGKQITFRVLITRNRKRYTRKTKHKSKNPVDI